MGTRNLTMVIKGGKPVVAQYGQWDGYPSGQGATILTFLRRRKKIDALLFKVDSGRVRFINKADEEHSAKVLKALGCEDGWMNDAQAKMYNATFPFLSRDHGGKILDEIAGTMEKEIVLSDSSSFAGDSLSCEWAYVVDFDKRILEVYSGFNRVPVPKGERFYSLNAATQKNKQYVKGYYPVKLVKKYSLDALPTKRTFVKECEKISKEMYKVQDTVRTAMTFGQSQP